MNASNQVEIPAAQFFAALDAMAPAKPALPEFSVTLNFRKCAAFSQKVKAADAQSALTLVRCFAAQCGFSGAESKPHVYEVLA
jgi:hypothetical protein